MTLDPYSVGVAAAAALLLSTAAMASGPGTGKAALRAEDALEFPPDLATTAGESSGLEDESPVSLPARLGAAGAGGEDPLAGVDGPLPLGPRQRPRYAAEVSHGAGSYRGSMVGPETWQARMTATLPGSGLEAKTRLGMTEAVPFLEDGHAIDRHGFMDVQVKGALPGLDYGLRYYTVGEDFDPLGGKPERLQHDRSGNEAWVAWSRGSVSLRPGYRHSYDNLTLDPDRPRFSEDTFGVTLAHVLTDWPVVGYSLSYFVGERTSSHEPDGQTPYAGPVSSLEGTLYYAGARWDASLSTSGWESRDEGSQGITGSVVRSHYLSGSFRPTDASGISATVGLVEEDYPGYDAHTSTREVALDAYYQPRRKVGFSAHAAYGTWENAAWYQDTAYAYAGADVTWTLRRGGGESSTVSIGVLYDAYTDHLNPQASSGGPALRVQFRHDFGAKGRPVAALGPTQR